MKKIISLLIIAALLLSIFGLEAYALKDYSRKVSVDLQEEISTEKEKTVGVIIVSDTLQTNNKPIPFYDSVFFKLYSPDYSIQEPELSLEQIQENIKTKRENIASQYQNYNEKMIAEMGLETQTQYVSKYAPVIFANVQTDKVYDIAKNENVKAISYAPPLKEDAKKLTPYLDTSKKTTRTNIIQDYSAFGYSGAGIKIGVLDTLQPYTNNNWLNNANITLYTTNTAYTESSYGGHATSILSILASQGSENTAVGLAPDAEYYCSPISAFFNTSDSLPSAYVSALDWLLDQNVNIINISTGLGEIYNSYTTTAYSGGYYLSWLIDHYSSTLNTCFVMAAGNSGSTGVGFPCMAYSAITVGNTNDNNTASITDDTLNPTSSYYNSLTPEFSSKPDICAPGTLIEINNSNKTYFGSNLTYEGDDMYSDTTGTSVSAPHVAGAIALLCEQENLLLYSPMAIKAILVTGVHTSKHIYVPSERIVSEDSNNPASSYVQYGAGILNTANNGLIAMNQTFDFGVISGTTTTSIANIDLTGGKNARISLSYELYTDDYNITLDNFDILLYDSEGNLIGSSETTFNPVEIIDVYIETSGTYTLKTIRRSSAANNVYMGLAWTQY